MQITKVDEIYVVRPPISVRLREFAWIRNLSDQWEVAPVLCSLRTGKDRQVDTVATFFYYCIFFLFLIWQGLAVCRKAFGAGEHLWRCAVVPLLELGCRFLHRTSHTCSTFDVGVLTHVPPPPPLLLYIWNTKLARVLPPATAGGALSLRRSLKVITFFFPTSLFKLNREQIRRWISQQQCRAPGGRKKKEKKRLPRQRCLNNI